MFALQHDCKRYLIGPRWVYYISVAHVFACLIYSFSNYYNLFHPDVDTNRWVYLTQKKSIIHMAPFKKKIE